MVSPAAPLEPPAFATKPTWFPCESVPKNSNTSPEARLGAKLLLRVKSEKQELPEPVTDPVRLKLPSSFKTMVALNACPPASGVNDPTYVPLAGLKSVAVKLLPTSFFPQFWEVALYCTLVPVTVVPSGERLPVLV